MTAQIVIDDGGGPVTGSVDRNNTYLGTLFTLGNFDDTGILAWQWTLLDRPIGSAAVLSASTTPSVTFTPDIAGTYLVRLKTFTDLAATILDDADEQVVGIRFAAPLDWRVPAAGETTQLDTNRGWATAVEETIRDLQSTVSIDVRGPNIVVGNSLAGDTINNCDFLDTGNGAGLAAAITAANAALKDVWIRKGTYDFSLVGGPVAPITIATRVQGAGTGATLIAGRPTGDQGMFILGSGVTLGSLESVTLQVRKPTGATLGALSVVNIVVGAMARVFLSFDQWDAPAAALTTLRYGIQLTAQTGFLEDVTMFRAPSLAGYGGANFIGFRIIGGGANPIGVTGKLSRCKVAASTVGDTTTLGCTDYCFQVETSGCVLRDCEAVNGRKAGFRVIPTGSLTLIQGCSVSFAATMTATGMRAFDVVSNGGGVLSRVRVSQCQAQGNSLVGTEGLVLQAVLGGDTVDRCVLTDNVIDGFVTGALLSAGAGTVDKSIMLGNQISTYTTAISLLGDTNSDFGHNQT